MTVGKVTADQLSRKAVVYVRQSTPDQVRNNRESQKRQYGLAERAREMGWRQVETIDEDLGRSGASSHGRTGFLRLVADVSMRQVGAVFSLEASRLARNNRDWYQLIDLCSLTGTLVVDHDGICDPRVLNDRLLLGLKGTMSEFELGLIPDFDANLARTRRCGSVSWDDDTEHENRIGTRSWKNDLHVAPICGNI